MEANSSDDIPILQRWYSFLSWMMDVTEKFPKRIRWSLTSRVESLSVEILEDLMEAKYRRKKLDLLLALNRKLARLRILLRLCHEKQYLSMGAYETASRRVDECGQMLGGWIKEQRGE
ncbi:MAG: diversity-generating retroelement protein Avd [Planctomycetes bacterium]|nr:diversity-generating retroelement protein Avd [Planctomycetota bacterium]